jgi:hypothetical protein
MLANGSDLNTVDNLSIEDAKALYETLRAGLWGPYGAAHQSYSTYLSLHVSKEVAIAVASGKKYKATPPREFHEMYPTIDDYMTLGLGKVSREHKTKSSMAAQALLAIPTEGAPSWLMEVSKQ